MEKETNNIVKVTDERGSVYGKEYKNLFGRRWGIIIDSSLYEHPDTDELYLELPARNVLVNYMEVVDSINIYRGKELPGLTENQKKEYNQLYLHGLECPWGIHIESPMSSDSIAVDNVSEAKKSTYFIMTINLIPWRLHIVDETTSEETVVFLPRVGDEIELKKFLKEIKPFGIKYLKRYTL